MVKVSQEIFNATSVKEAINIYQNKMGKTDSLEISACLLNPFLRVMEIMQCPCVVYLEFYSTFNKTNNIKYRIKYPGSVPSDGIGKVNSL